MSWVRTSFIAVMMVFISACSSMSKTAEVSLYERIGGQERIERLVDAFVTNIANDEQVFHYFAKSNVTHFRNGFVSHFCDVVGGPCEYAGDNMVDIHTGMNINEADFNRVVELLIRAMEDVGISYRLQNEVLSRLAPMRGEIINM